MNGCSRKSDFQARSRGFIPQVWLVIVGDMNDEREDGWLLGAVVRFVCGAGFGALVGVGIWWWVMSFVWVIVVACALVFGILSMVLGDDFWTSCAEWIQWW